MAAKMSFTAKKRAYVAARIAGERIQDAAISAGYSPDTARQAGSRLEKDPDVQDAFARAKFDDMAKMPKNNEKKAVKEKKKPIKLPDVSVSSVQQLPDWTKMLAPPKSKKNSLDIQETQETQEILILETDDPIEYFKQVMRDRSEDPRLRMKAAENLAAYTCNKLSEKGKKEQKAEEAKEVAKKFGSIPPPKMTLVKK